MDTMLEIEDVKSSYELERGKPMPSLEHAEAQLNLQEQILAYRAYKPYAELNLDLNGNKTVPDIAVFEVGALSSYKGVMWIPLPPPLVIEILSPNQGLRTLFEKAAHYVQSGVEEAWVVIPDIQSITVCKPDGSQKTYIEGSITHSTTGITVTIEKTFS